jgi:acyl-[acyl-carrier-protein]-phospholipid O-acyltransferase / long-chain-fatty-acid--[acyl-carrier-protein] ligase
MEQAVSGTDSGQPDENEEQGGESSKLGGFWGFIGLQFQGALSDNLFKFTLILIIIDRYSGQEGLSATWQAVVGAVFAIPFLLFAGISGALSNRFSKRFVILSTKVWEIGVMALGGVALYFYSSAADPATWRFVLLVFVLFLMSMQSTFFSPSKYGILPEILPLKKLTWGNGILEMTTFVSILLGMVLANFLYLGVFQGQHLERMSFVLVGIAVLGLLSGSFLKKVPPANPEEKIRANHFPQLWQSYREIFRDRVLVVTVIGIAYFWTLGSLFTINSPVWAQYALGIAMPVQGPDATAFDRFMSTFQSPGIMALPVAIGIGLGAYIVGSISRRGIELGFVPLGGLGLSLFCFVLGFARPGTGPDGELALAPLGMWLPMVICLVMAGVSAGFYSVPLYALLQHRAPLRNRAGIIASSNFANFAGILLSALFYMLLTGPLSFNGASVFVLLGIVTFGTTIYMITVLPEALLGLISTVFTRFIYRTRMIGPGSIPRQGPALLVCNHVSMVDALLVQAISPRPVRFVVWREIFDSPFLGYFLRIMEAIPISSDMRPRSLMSSLMTASNALGEGELVCIFADGQQITRKGVKMPFRRGFTKMLSKSAAPVIPIYLDGVWGSIFSYERKKFVWKMPSRFPYHVTVGVGEALPFDVPMSRLRQAAQELSAECALSKKDVVAPLHHKFIRQARAHSRDFCVSDTVRGMDVKYGRALIGTLVLARRLKPLWRDQKTVGIYLPPMAASVLVNAAAAMSGRTAVNLNYTTGRDVLEHCIREAELQTVLTSKTFLSKLGQDPPPHAVYLEDIAPQVKFAWKPKFLFPFLAFQLTEAIPALLMARFATIRGLERFAGARRPVTPDDLATIIFSSGSTGVPKGVMLTHFNIASNIESFNDAVSVWSDDKMLGILPLFHSFGYTVSQWGCLCLGYGVVHHTNPLEAKVIGDVVEKYGITMLVCTPTFLQHYIRRIEPEKFKTLDFVLTGAEKLTDKVASDFEERFGVEVLEGYGTTECAPVVSTNVDEYRAKAFMNCTRRGTVGRPIPGVAIRVLDLETGEVLPANRTGMIHARGPNIMMGYLNQPEKTAEVLRDGWYETGDVGMIDDDGFITITDRLARFSKIGGEMVPHQRIEDELHMIVGTVDRVFAVTSVPDERKGERLAVVHTADEAQLAGINQKLSDAGLPNIWIPRSDMYFKVEEIPILGTGKLDLRGVRKLAVELAERTDKNGKSGAGVVEAGRASDS